MITIARLLRMNNSSSLAMIQKTPTGEYLFLFKYIMCIATSALLINVILLLSKTRLTFCYTLHIRHYTIKNTILPFRDTQKTNTCPTCRIQLRYHLRVHHISFYQQQSHKEIIYQALIGGHNVAGNYKIPRMSGILIFDICSHYSMQTTKVSSNHRITFEPIFPL